MQQLDLRGASRSLDSVMDTSRVDGVTGRRESHLQEFLDLGVVERDSVIRRFVMFPIYCSAIHELAVDVDFPIGAVEAAHADFGVAGLLRTCYWR